MSTTKSGEESYPANAQQDIRLNGKEEGNDLPPTNSSTQKHQVAVGVGQGPSAAQRKGAGRRVASRGAHQIEGTRTDNESVLGYQTNSITLKGKGQQGTRAKGESTAEE